MINLFDMSRVSLKSVADSCGLSIAIVIRCARLTSLSLEFSLVFIIIIWLKERSPVAVPTDNVSRMSKILNISGRVFVYRMPSFLPLPRVEC